MSFFSCCSRYYEDDAFSVTTSVSGSDLAASESNFSYYGDRCPGTNGANHEQIQIVNMVGFALDYVAQFLFGILGILGNVIAMIILARSKKLKSVFNRLLTCLLIVHTLYIVNSLTLQEIRKKITHNPREREKAFRKS